MERIEIDTPNSKMYVDEFELIWNKQAQFHAELTNELKTLFGGRKLDGYKEDGIFYFIRDLYVQKTFSGKLFFEPRKTKCPISAIPFEQFRVWQMG